MDTASSGACSNIVAAKDVKCKVFLELTEVVLRRVKSEMFNIFHLIFHVSRCHRFHIFILIVSRNVGVNAITWNKAAFVSHSLVCNAVFLVRATVGKLLHTHSEKMNYKNEQ